MKLSIIILLLLGSFVHNLSAQTKEEEGRFTASIVAGVNISQIDGDDAWGYRKVGFNGGARGGILFGERMELCTEILFSQKGSVATPNSSRSGNAYTVHMDYIEVPVLFYYKDWQATDAKNRNYMRVMIGGGFSYSQLLNLGIQNSSGLQNNSFSKSDFMFMLDANFFLHRNWGINVRWARSLASIYNDNPAGNRPDYVINRSIIIRLVFKF
ncbi:outer membrane beta-barrel protein [Aureispira sp. CCB-E]|uniref:outer membrane beta-barrel protein n=1 Tax=Aureispira sp. CCB-E TaxID=3051121 RepID=UPI0028692E53|nr:outer membrane beta-barrel protein [Aureispira sp. CCB-E]WMX14749.1 outer membrane beta-barrel protein [Aureispira sp. CCB-E]